MAVYSQQPTMCWAPGHHGVCPQWWRPIQTAGKLSTAPCTALLPYSWPCGLLIIHKGKPWRHQIHSNSSITTFVILCPSWFLMWVRTLLFRLHKAEENLAVWPMLVLDSFGVCQCLWNVLAVACISWHAWFTLSTWTHGCVFSAAHHVLGTWSSWCMSAVVASYTDCWQVEYCSLHGTASIFLALWITDNPQGQTMEASNSFKFLDNYFCHTLSFLILNVSSHFALQTS